MMFGLSFVGACSWMSSFSKESCSSSLRYSMIVRSTTWANGTSWQRINQMSIILMSEVEGKPSILLIKIVVITSMVVRFTLKAASKKKGLKKVVAKVIAVRRSVGKYVVINSVVTFRFKTIVIFNIVLPLFFVSFWRFQSIIRKIGMPSDWFMCSSP